MESNLLILGADVGDQRATLVDGPRDGWTRTYLSGERLQLSATAWQQLDSLEVPIFLHANNPHERLFVAALDGTGDDFIHDPKHATNVGLIYDQLTRVGDDRIRTGYVEGPGTQRDLPTRWADDISGFTAGRRAERMYRLFIEQAAQWKSGDPDTQISIASFGFSRGAEEVALLTHIIEERGIQDPAGAQYTYDAHHQITDVEYTRPALVGGHEVAQAVALFDPVGTGKLMHADRRPTPSVISGVQLTAVDERRRAFKSDHIIDPGISADGRFAGLNLPGAHCDVGGGCSMNGLSNRAGNFGIAYLNALSDRRYLQALPEFDDPQRNVIHRSEDGLLLYGADYKVDRATPDGYNEVLVDERLASRLADARNAEPRDEALNARFDHQTVAHAMQNPVFEPPPTVAKSPSELDLLIERLYRAAAHADPEAMDAVANDYLDTPQGQAWQQQVLRSASLLQVPDLVAPPMQRIAALPHGEPRLDMHAAPVM